MQLVYSIAVPVLVASFAMPALAQNGPSPLYVVSILGSDTQTAAELASAYKADVFVDLIHHEGRFISAPNAVAKEMDNDWLPDGATAFRNDAATSFTEARGDFLTADQAPRNLQKRT
ncbi:hypothetical protein [uncultured Tateyamaria sp.]|uniref:hypothetical protein n=1 Tax=uncultured Tateyamaria sp. TaxID=455651 RepID=UPI0026058E96|nr:hypothetical protein [uncultured Tateyamaria sp.]